MYREHTNAVRLRPSVDRRCPKYERKERKVDRERKGGGAVKAGRGVIYSQVSCTGG
jgi:hypothetical protein